MARGGLLLGGDELGGEADSSGESKQLLAGAHPRSEGEEVKGCRWTQVGQGR